MTFNYQYDPNINYGYTITTTDSTTPVYTIPTGINGTTNSTFNYGSITTNDNLNPSTLEVKGKANFEGDITIKGKSLTETLENIEKRLAILHVNPKLEKKWESLKELGDMYRALEAEIIAKEELWNILKK